MSTTKTSKERILDHLKDPETKSYMAKRGAEIDLAVKIKMHRERLGLTQRQLAEKMGVPQPTITRMESGEGGINTGTLEKFCLVAGLELGFTTANKDKNPIEVAEYVLLRCYDILNEKYDITILKLLKIMYYVQAKHLVDYGGPFFTHEFQAWNKGPVHTTIYNHYRDPGEPTKTILPKQKEFNLNKAEKQLIDYILFEFEGGLAYKSAYQLVDKTHEDSPWKNAHEKGNNTPITTESMIEFYKSHI